MADTNVANSVAASIESGVSSPRHVVGAAASHGAPVATEVGDSASADWLVRPAPNSTGALYYRRRDGWLSRTLPEELALGASWWSAPEARAGAPLKVYLDVTNRCNLSCAHCITDSSPFLDTSNELSTPRLLELIAELASIGVFEVAIAGGEPLLHPDCDQIMRAITGSGMNLIVTTNGLLMAGSMLDTLVELDPLEVRVSFDGGPMLHEVVRGPHTYHRSMEMLRRVTTAGLRTTARLTLCDGGDDELGVLFGDLVSSGVSTVKVAVAKRLGRAATPAGEFLVRRLPDPTIQTVLTELGVSHGLEVRLAADDFPQQLDDGRLSKLRDVETSNCGAGSETAYVSPVGELLGCVALPNLGFGPLATTPFIDVWEGDLAHGYRATASGVTGRRLCDSMAQPSASGAPTSTSVSLGATRRR